MVENINHSFTRSVVEKTFKSHDISVTATNMLRDRENPINIKEHMDLDTVTFGIMYDMVVFDPKTLTCQIYEVKYSKQQVPDQYRHIKNEEKCSMTSHRYGDITGRYVIYRGDNAQIEEVQYLNVEEYLKSL